MSGMRLGNLTVIGRAPNAEGNSRARWLCKCDCGKTKIMRGDVLRKGVTSCGCKTRYKHGGCVGGKVSRLYVIWRDMKSRCSNPKNNGYSDYGGRGISVCDEWYHSFENFQNWAKKNGYRDDLTIDRIDADGNYEPENCRWISNIKQQRNKRNTVFITANGICMCIPEWAEHLGVPKSKLYKLYRQPGKIEPYILAALEGVPS